MAKITVKGLDEYALKLSRLEGKTTEIAKKAVRAGANPVIDEVRKRLEALPSDTFRYLQPGEVFNGIPEKQRKDLLDGLGVAKPDIDMKGNVNTKVGFEGYGSYPTKKYPKGLPNALLARAIESGSSVRKKIPFVRPAVTKTKKAAQEEMAKVIDKELKTFTE